MQSKFRKMFWFRLAFGSIIFVLCLVFFITGLLNFEHRNVVPLVMCAFILVSLSCLSIDIFKIFKITLSENAIIKTTLFTGFEKLIPFSSIQNIELQKVRFKSSRGNISDGHQITIIKFENEKLIISPDSFENYQELINFIKQKSQHLYS